MTRFCAISAACHAAAVSIVLVLVRIGDTGPSAVDSVVEVSIVMSEVLEPAPPASPLPAGRATRGASEYTPIDAAPRAVEPRVEATSEVAASDDDWFGELPAVRPNFEDGGRDPDARGGASATASVSWSANTGAIQGSAATEASVRAWLEQHKRYPRAAAQRRIQGEATLELEIDGAGGVRSARILASSGHRVLDEEVLRMVERATPFPGDPTLGIAVYRIVIEFYLEDR